MITMTNFPLSIAFFICLLAILPQLSFAIKCFKCSSELDCAINDNFKNDSQSKLWQYTDEECKFNPNYTPACMYVITQNLAVQQRGCDSFGILNRYPFCTNRATNVLVCYCLTDWCNGIDQAYTASALAQYYFKRQEPPRVEFQLGSASNIMVSGLWFTVIIGTVVVNML